jgi:hypothetical protein
MDPRRTAVPAKKGDEETTSPARAVGTAHAPDEAPEPQKSTASAGRGSVLFFCGPNRE